MVRLNDLHPGRPLLVPVTSRKHDAWTEYPQHIVGRVWLVRSSNGEETVRAFTAVYPPLGLHRPGGCWRQNVCLPLPQFHV